MLAFLRKRVKYLSWVLWVVILVFVGYVFYDFGTVTPQAGGGAPAVAASAGPYEVSADEFRNRYRDMESRLREMYGGQFTPELAQQMGLARRVLDDLINREILLGEAERLGLTVTDTELRDAILAQPGLKDAAGRFIGTEQYAAQLRAAGLTPAAFERQLRQDLLLQKLSALFRANVYVPDAEVERAYRDQVEKAKIRYLLLPRARFAAEAKVSQQELAAWFEANKDKLKLPAQRRVATLVVEPAKLAAEVAVDEAAISAYYNEHQEEFNREEQVQARHILVKLDDDTTDEQARQRLQEARRRIEGGADFAAVAREISEDPGSKDSGGDLGFFGRGQMVKEFEDAAFGGQPGQLVGPVKSGFGYHLIQVAEKTAAGQQPLAAVRDSIRERLAASRTQEIAQARAKQIAARLAEEEPETAEEVQAIAGEFPYATYALSEPFGAQEPVPGIGWAPALNEAAFKLEEGGVSEPVQVPTGWAVLWVQEVLEPRVPELAEVEARVRQAAELDKQGRLARERLEQAKAQLAQGKALADVAAELGIEVQEAADLGGQGTVPGLGHNTELVKAALALPVGQVGGPIQDPRGAILFEVVERTSWDPQKFQAEKGQTRAQLEEAQSERLLGSLIEQRRRELEVSYNRELLEFFGMALEPEPAG